MSSTKASPPDDHTASGGVVLFGGVDPKRTDINHDPVNAFSQRARTNTGGMNLRYDIRTYRGWGIALSSILSSAA